FAPGAGFDYFSTTERDANNVSRDVPFPSPVRLKLEGARSVRVRAVDGDGHPIPRVSVLVSGISRIGNRSEQHSIPSREFAVTTGADGVALFDWLPNDFPNRLDLVAESAEYRQFDDVHISPDDRRAEIDVRMLRRAKLAGRVFRADGKP